MSSFSKHLQPSKVVFVVIAGILVASVLSACDSKEEKIIKMHQEEAISRASLPPEFAYLVASSAQPSSS